MQKTLNVSQTIGLAGLFVDAKHQQTKAYYDQLGFIGLPEQRDNLFIAISTIAGGFSQFLGAQSLPLS